MKRQFWFYLVFLASLLGFRALGAETACANTRVVSWRLGKDGTPDVRSGALGQTNDTLCLTWDSEANVVSFEFKGGPGYQSETLPYLGQQGGIDIYGKKTQGVYEGVVVDGRKITVLVVVTNAPVPFVVRAVLPAPVELPPVNKYGPGPKPGNSEVTL